VLPSVRHHGQPHAGVLRYPSALLSADIALRRSQIVEKRLFRLICLEVLGQVFQSGLGFLVQRRRLLNGDTRWHGITGINLPAPPLPRGCC
jgi:hypothetical protein